jgi:chemotaxis protein CheX
LDFHGVTILRLVTDAAWILRQFGFVLSVRLTYLFGDKSSDLSLGRRCEPVPYGVSFNVCVTVPPGSFSIPQAFGVSTMTATTATSTAYFSIFVDATTSVFDTMLGVAIAPREAQFGNQNTAGYDITGVVGLSGDAKGILTLSLTRDVALAATEAMLGERPADLDASVADTVGELANMVAGMAKGRLPGSLNMSLPSVLTGANQCTAFPSGITPTRVTFDSPWGPAVVEFGLAEATG